MACFFIYICRTVAPSAEDLQKRHDLVAPLFATARWRQCDHLGPVKVLRSSQDMSFMIRCFGSSSNGNFLADREAPQSNHSHASSHSTLSTESRGLSKSRFIKSLSFFAPISPRRSSPRHPADEEERNNTQMLDLSTRPSQEPVLGELYATAPSWIVSCAMSGAITHSLAVWAHHQTTGVRSKPPSNRQPTEPLLCLLARRARGASS